VSDAVWYDETGEPCGYLSYASSRSSGPEGYTQVLMREFVPLNGAAYQGLIRFVLTHDLAGEITWYGPIEDPLAYALDDAEQVKREFVDDMMLRVVDIEKAVAARPAGPGAPDGALTIAISDAAAPWNQGQRIECGRNAVRDEDGRRWRSRDGSGDVRRGVRRVHEGERGGAVMAGGGGRRGGTAGGPALRIRVSAERIGLLLGCRAKSPGPCGGQVVRFGPWKMTPAAMARRVLGMRRRTARAGSAVRIVARTRRTSVAERTLRRMRRRFPTRAMEAQTAGR
jgi:hypothetical protein